MAKLVGAPSQLKMLKDKLFLHRIQNLEDFIDLDVYDRGNEELAAVKESMEKIQAAASAPVAAIGSVMAVGSKKADDNLGRK